MSSWYFIKGEPQPHPRPRATNMGKLGVRMYQPITDWQKLVKFELVKLKLEPLEAPTPVGIHLRFRLSRPKAHYGTGRNAERLKPSAPLHPAAGRAGGDADNLAKSVLDAMNGVVFDDDKQVVSLNVEKGYADDERGPGVWFAVCEFNGRREVA